MGVGVLGEKDGGPSFFYRVGARVGGKFFSA